MYFCSLLLGKKILLDFLGFSASICKVFNFSTSPEVISNLWRCLGSLVIKMVQNYLRKITKKAK